MARLDEITKTLQELKTEYSIIRKEILGIGVSESSGSQGNGLIENKTLREIVEETQFQVKAINDKILDYGMQKDMEKLELKAAVKQIEKEERDKEYPVVEILRKTIAEERIWIKEKFNALKIQKTVADGESLWGTTAEAISSSIAFSEEVNASCTIKISNFLDSALTDCQYYFTYGSRNSGPSGVVGHQSEVISLVGNRYGCFFLSSFAISGVLRLSIRCYSDLFGNITFGIGFTPGDIPTDETLFNKLNIMPQVPDVWMIKEMKKVPLELFVSHGNLIVRGHMSQGPRSVVHIEILEMNPEDLSTLSGKEIKRIVVDGNSVLASLGYPGAISRLSGNYGRISCAVEIVNCLSVRLRNRGNFYCKCGKNNFMAQELLPFQRQTFFGADNADVEAMFSYDIDSTDFAIVIALKVGPSLNTFAAAFFQLPVGTGAKHHKVLMNPRQWKTHDYRKYSTASEGVQSIQMGNIRAEIQMTEEEQSLLKIRIFAC